MGTSSRPPGSSTHAALGDRAVDDLRFIRHTIERGPAFTGVPGRGGVAMGVTGLVAAALASTRTTPEGWLLTWLAAAVVAIGIGTWSMQRKAERAGLPFLSGSGRRFLLGFLPPALAGAVLTVVLYQTGAVVLLPGTWLLLFGAAVATAGTFSVKAIPLMGSCFMILGTIALLAPGHGGDVLLGTGFGLLHVIFGLHIARNHGG